ncbi:MAG: helix-turn-helix transcriptional regulator [Bacilli bacterium]|nr:helix-turn-helix transcriptional regulator [Bacilli bacterium]
MQKVDKFKSKDDVQFIVGTNVRKMCKDKHINLMEFAEEIDMSYEYLRHIVSIGGQKSLSFYSMYKIAKILGVSMDDLCEGIFEDKK